MFVEKLWQAFKDLIYPPLCLHCSHLLTPKELQLCSLCLPLLELTDPQERCSLCFSLQGHTQPCAVCRPCISPFKGLAAAFEYCGPAATLVKQLKYGHMPYLYKGMAAFLAAQFVALAWPKPDLIVPMPISLAHRLERGYNQSLLLAQGLADILAVPLVDILKRNHGGYSQAGLTQKQRQELSERAFFLKDDQQIRNKTILLIDDVMTTRTTMHRAASALQQGLPKEIYGLSFCCGL